MSVRASARPGKQDEKMRSRASYSVLDAWRKLRIPSDSDLYVYLLRLGVWKNGPHADDNLSRRLRVL